MIRSGARPTVYVLRPGTLSPLTFTACESVQHAVNVAVALRDVCGVTAWVAAWGRFAHVPRRWEADIEAMYELEAACG